MKITKITRSDSGKKTTRFYLDFSDNGGQRHKLAGYESRQKTETLRDRISELLTLDYQGRQATPELMEWFADEPERMRKRLVEWGLLPETKEPEPPKTIKQLVEKGLVKAEKSHWPNGDKITLTDKGNSLIELQLTLRNNSADIGCINI